MKCYYHRENDAISECSLCSKPICAQCVHVVNGENFCPDCMRDAVSLLKKTQTPEYKSISPAAAGWLALIPALGAIYNGTYIKAFYQFSIFALLILIADATDLGILGFGAFLYYVYTIIDAYKSAKKIKMGLLSEEKTSLLLSNKPLLQGAALVIIGVLFLLYNFNVFDFYVLRKLWPLLLVGAGIYMIWKNRKEITGGASTATAHGSKLIDVEPSAVTKEEAAAKGDKK